MNITTTLQSTITLGTNLHMIAITGGPCSGKTTGLAKLVAMLQDRGYKVLLSPESATKLIGGGIHPWELSSSVFQKQILLDTLMQEERFLEAACVYRDLGHKVVVLCDRGAMDGQAYIPTDEFEELVKSLGLSLPDICERRYHAVIHMRTAALGAEEFYTLENNSARKETVEEARELDQRTLEAWQRHHHPRTIDNSTGFEEKINRLLAEVCAVLGDPEPIEREQKYLIEIPDPSAFSVHITESDITQDYLKVGDGEDTARVRARGDKNGTSYFYTTKKRIGPGESLEIERMIGKDEYKEFLKQRNTELQTISKRRITFFFESQFVEIDVFTGPEDIVGLAFMEIEQINFDKEPILPPFIKVIKNVTGDERYLNRSLANG